MVQSRDVIGWTNEEDYTLISFNFHPDYKTTFVNFENDDYPQVNKTVEVTGIGYDGVFSVAVEIIQR